MSRNIYDNFLRHGAGAYPCDPPTTLGEALSPGEPLFDIDDVADAFGVEPEDVEHVAHGWDNSASVRGDEVQSRGLRMMWMISGTPRRSRSRDDGGER